MSDESMTAEYASVEAVARMQELINTLSEKAQKLENHVTETLDRRFLEIEERNIERNSRLKLDIVEIVDTKLLTEREERNKAIAKAEERLDKFIERTTISMTDISSNINKVSETVNRVDGKVGAWHIAVEANNESFKDIKKHLDETESRLDRMNERQQLLEEQQKQTHKTIHGSASEDGPDSLFRAITNLDSTMDQGFKTLDTTLEGVSNLARDNANSIEKIERERAEEKERWQKRLDTAKSFADAMTNKPLFWITLIVTIIGIFVSINPELQDFFREIFASILPFYNP